MTRANADSIVLALRIPYGRKDHAHPTDKPRDTAIRWAVRSNKQVRAVCGKWAEPTGSEFDPGSPHACAACSRKSCTTVTPTRETGRTAMSCARSVVSAWFPTSALSVSPPSG